MSETTVGLPRAVVSANGHEPDDLESVAPAPAIIFSHYRAEDGGVLDCWREHYSTDWLYVTGHESWYRWEKTHWVKDEGQALQGQIQALLQELNTQVRAAIKKTKDGDKLKMLESYKAATKRTKSRVASVEGMAQAHRAKPARLLDGGNVLNLRNGTLDLDTYELRPHDPSDLLTYTLDYSYDLAADCPRFEQFVNEVLIDENTGRPDLDMATLLQELVGYTLTTETKHETMAWLSGGGSNGKTVLIMILQALLGPMAVSVDFQTIGLPGNYDLAELPGKRIMFSTESERGGHTAEGYIKRIVSGERIRARPIYGRTFEFNSTAKIWWAMNDRPIIKDTGNSMWRRLRLIPFNRTFTETDRDPELLPKLLAELPGILNWAIRGLMRLRKHGRFTQAGAVTDAINEYRRESNPVAQWLDECMDYVKTGGSAGGYLYDNYKEWCKRNGRTELNSTNFGREIKRLGVGWKRTEKGVFYGLSLKTLHGSQE